MARLWHTNTTNLRLSSQKRDQPEPIQSFPALGADTVNRFQCSAPAFNHVQDIGTEPPTSFFASIGPMPLTKPLLRYRSIPSTVVGTVLLAVIEGHGHHSFLSAKYPKSRWGT